MSGFCCCICVNRIFLLALETNKKKLEMKIDEQQQQQQFDLSKPNDNFVEWVTNNLLNIRDRSSFPVTRLVLYCKNDIVESHILVIEENILITKQSQFFVSSHNIKPGNLVLTSVSYKLEAFPYGIGTKNFVQQLVQDFKVFAEQLNPYFYIEIMFEFSCYEITGGRPSIEIKEVNSEFKSTGNLDFLLMDISSSTMTLGLFNENDFSELCSKNKICLDS